MSFVGGVFEAVDDDVILQRNRVGDNPHFYLIFLTKQKLSSPVALPLTNLIDLILVLARHVAKSEMR